MPSWNMDQWTLMWVQVATGFMGALTLVFLGRIIWRKLGWMAEMKAFLEPGGVGPELFIQTIRWARREVLYHGPSASGEFLVAALAEAKKRGATVDLMLDPRHAMQDADAVKKLLEQGLDPMLVGNPGATQQFLVVIDRKQVLLATPSPNPADGPISHVIHIRGHADVVQKFRDHLYQLKAQAKPLKLDERGQRLAA